MPRGSTWRTSAGSCGRRRPGADTLLPTPLPGRPSRPPPASRRRPPDAGLPAAALPTRGGRPSSGPDAVQLDAAQRAAVEHARGPARVLAPAGSGKTKTLISRVVELVDRGADPSGILMLAFNRKAAEQLEERLAALGIASTRRLGSPAERGAGPRAARAAAAADRPATSATARPASTAPPSTPSATATSARCCARASRSTTTAARCAPSWRAPWRPPASRCASSSRAAAATRSAPSCRASRACARRSSPRPSVEVRIESLGDTPLLDLPFAAIHAQYARAQAATGLQSFDDQIYFAVADMLADPSHRAFIQARFDHVLVDEFQDLNGAQLALVDVLSRPHRRLFVVGDDDQLIYGWRQADPRGILEFHRRMPPRPWSATYTLCTNYRCSRAVVETGARLVAHNVVREAKDIRPREGAQDGAVRFFGAPSWPERAAAMCAFLRAEKQRLGCDWRDLAVLCRYRSQQLLVALALDAGDVPRTPALGCTLFTHPAATLLRAYLDLVRAPDELPGPALAGLLNRPNRYLSAAVVEAIGGGRTAVGATCGRSRPRSLRPGRARSPPSSTSSDRLGPELASADALTAEDLVWTVVEAFALDDLWAAEADAAAAGDGAGSDGAGPLEVFDSLLLLAETYPDPAEYLRTWDRLRADEEAHAGVADDTLAREESEEDRVVIGTIHAAKGREYDSVVIPDYDCDVSRWSAAEVEEERRVVYVGVTRARDAALFTVDTSSGFVHPFLRELVEAPDPGEHEALSAWLDEECDRRPAVPHRRPARRDRGAVSRAGPRGASPSGSAAYLSHSRVDGSGGATKCFAVGCVPGRRYCQASSCSSRSVTVRRWCCRMCSFQLGSTNDSMKRWARSASRYTDQSVAPVRRRTRPTRRRARRKSSSASGRTS